MNGEGSKIVATTWDVDRGEDEIEKEGCISGDLKEERQQSEWRGQRNQ